ncbi:MAG: DUF309 domain-containing protein [Sulfurovum sp.]
MAELNSDIEGVLREYIKFLKEEEYFEAHEVLEESWHYLRSIKSPLVNLVKGLINGAIAFEHIKRDKKNASIKAKKVIISYDRYKGLYCDSIEYAFLFKEAIMIVEELRKKEGI